MSRCLRSPVDAGSIPYSAVSHPRPLPTSQRGTDSWALAVQITRVPPQRDQRRARGRAHEPGLDRHRAQLVRRPAVGALAHRGHTSSACSATCSTGPTGSCRKRVPAARSASGSPERQEAVVALHGGRVAQPAAAEHVLDLPRDRVAGADDLHAAAEHPLQQRPDQRVVRAAEDHRVHLRLAQRPRVVAHRLDHLGVERRAALDQRHQPRAGHPGHGHERVRRRDRLLVGAAVDRRLRGHVADAAVAGRGHGLHRPGLHDAQHVDARASSAASGRAAPAAPPTTRCCRPPRAA